MNLHGDQLLKLDCAGKLENSGTYVQVMMAHWWFLDIA